MAASGAALILFLRRERTASCPAYDLPFLARNRTFALSNLAAALNYAATFAVTFYLALYLQEIRGLSPRAAGLLMAFQPLLQTLLSPVAGKLSDRFDPGKVASVGMASCAVGLALLSLVGPGTPIRFVLVPLGCLGVGFGLFSSSNTNAILTSAGPGRSGFASASVSVMRVLGQAVSMGTVSTAFALTLGGQTLNASTHGAYLQAQRGSFILFALICTAGVFLSAARGTVIEGTTNEKGG
jgi:predicted MFS family arabinose efflux permease